MTQVRVASYFQRSGVLSAGGLVGCQAVADVSELCTAAMFKAPFRFSDYNSIHEVCMRAICPAHLILLHWTALETFDVGFLVTCRSPASYHGIS